MDFSADFVDFKWERTLTVPMGRVPTHCDIVQVVLTVTVRIHPISTGSGSAQLTIESYFQEEQQRNSMKQS